MAGVRIVGKRKMTGEQAILFAPKAIVMAPAASEAPKACMERDISLAMVSVFVYIVYLDIRKLWKAKRSILWATYEPE